MGSKVKKEIGGYLDLTSGLSSLNWGSRAYNRIKLKGGSVGKGIENNKLISYMMLGIILFGLLAIVFLFSTNSSFELSGKFGTGDAVANSEDAGAINTIEQVESLQKTIIDLKEVVKALAQYLSIKDSSGNLISAEVEDIDGGVILTPGSGPVSKITFYNLRKVGNNVALGIDSVASDESFEKIYAIDPSELEFDNATVTVQASGDSLYKCTDWNFTNQECFGRWKKLRDIQPGQEYNFTIDAYDPGFGEGNYSIELLDEEGYLYNYTESIANHVGNTEDVELNISDPLLPIEVMDFHGRDTTSNITEVIAIYGSTDTNDTRVQEVIEINAQNISFDDFHFKKTASGKHLLECGNWSDTTNTCIGKNWTKVKDVVKDSQYEYISDRKKVTYAETANSLAVFNKNFKLIEYNQNITDEDAEVSDVEYEFLGFKINKLKFFSYNKSGNRHDLIVEHNFNVRSPSGGFASVFSVDPENITFDYAELNATAQGNYLFKCIEWNASTQECYGDWKRVRELTPGESYTVNLTAVDPGYLETNNSIVLIDNNDTLLEYNETILSNSSGLENVKLQIFNSSISEIIIYGHNSSAGQDELKIKDNLTIEGYVNPYSIDPTNLAFVNATVTTTASSGNLLMKCVDWNFTTQECYGDWRPLAGITAGESYNIKIDSIDPGFAETNGSIFEGFESYSSGFDLNESDDWETSSLGWEAVTSSPYVGAYSAVYTGNSGLEEYANFLINGSGYSAVNVSFYIKTAALDGGEYMRVEWYDGSTWQNLTNNTSPTDYTYYNYSFTENDEEDLRLRFVCISNLPNEHCYIDNIFVNGLDLASTISLVAPADGYVEIDSQYVDFVYNVTSEIPNITSCTLNIVGEDESSGNFTITNTTISKDVNQSFTANFTVNDLYYWNISCINDANSSSISETRNMTMNVAGLLAPLSTTMQSYWWLSSSDGTIGNENASYDTATVGDTLHLRAGVGAAGLAWKNQELEIYYSLTGAFAGEEIQVTATSENVSFWDDLDHVDQTLITASGTTVLTGTTTTEHYIESFPSATLVQVAAGNQGEWDFALNFSQSGTYYLQVQDTIAPLDTYNVVPQITVQEPNDPPVVTLVSPANDTTDTDGDLTFRCNVTEDTELSNLTLYVWNSTGEYYSNLTSVSGLFNESEWNLTSVPNGNYTWNCLAYDNVNQADWADSNWTLQLAFIPPRVEITVNEVYGLDSAQVRVDSFNSSNLEEIEFMVINATLNAYGAVGNISDWYLNFTAGGTSSCSLGNKQSSICYNYSNTVNKWIQFINGTETATYDGTSGNAGDRITVVQSGSNTSINLLITIDEHYNPNVFKWYDALYNFSDVKWQNGTDQVITNDNFLKISVNQSMVPLDADQYKLDFRVNYSASPNEPTSPLQAYACNSSYITGDPDVFTGCVLITEKLPAQLQDDGTKFRGVLTGYQISQFGDVKYIILKTDEIVESRNYQIKTYKATAGGYTTHWEYSNDSASTWNNLADGYETELNINWFYNGADPTAFMYSLWTNATGGNENSTEGNVTWAITVQNYPPIVDIISPGNNETFKQPYNITFSVGDDNNVNSTLYLYQNGSFVSVLVSDMNQSNSSFYWSEEVNSGAYELLLDVCELGTSDLFCTNTTHTIVLDNTGPTVTIVNPKNKTYNVVSVLFDLETINDAQSCWYSFNSGANTSIDCDGAINLTANEGGNTLFAYANDTLGNIEESSIVFSVNTSQILDISVLSPAYGAIINDPTPSITLLAFDQLYSSINYTTYIYYGNGTLYAIGNNGTLSNGTQETFALSPALTLEGNSTNYSLVVEAIDEGLNYVNSSVISLTLTTPILDLLSPADGYYDSDGDINFTFSYLSELFPTANCSLYLNSVYNQSNETTLNNVNTTFEVTGISEGINQNWSVICLMGELSAQDTLTFSVDKTFPEVSFVSPLNQTYNTSTILVNLSATDSLGSVSTIWFFNGTGNETYTVPVNRTFAEGSNTIYAYVNDTAGNFNSTSVTFYVGDTTPPSVILLHPWGFSHPGHYHDDGKEVDITVNVTDFSGVDTILANVTLPDLTSVIVSEFGYGLTSDNFETDTEGTNWVLTNITGTGQTCYADVSNDVPGKMIISLDAGAVQTEAHCGYNSIKRMVGNFDVNVSFNITTLGEDGIFSFRSNSVDNTQFVGLRFFVDVQKISGVTNYVFGFNNGSSTYQQTVPTIDTTGKLRFKRFNMTTTGTPTINLYYWNNTGSGWVESNFGDIPIPGSTRTQFMQLLTYSIGAGFGSVNVTFDDFQISGDNFTYALFNQTGEVGNYSVRIIANDTLGYVNDTESALFEIEEVNDVPSRPFISEPDAGNIISGLTNISWIQIVDDENDNVRFNITLLYPNGTDYAEIVSNYGDINTTYYEWDSSTQADGVYGIQITVFENESVERLSATETLDGNFTIDNNAPQVIVIYPLNHTIAQNHEVSFILNSTDISPLSYTEANITSPNGTSYITNGFSKVLQNDEFDNNTLGTNWEFRNDSVASGQNCYADINNTVGGKAFLQIGGVDVVSSTSCGLSSLKKTYGDYDMNITFNITHFGEDTYLVLRSNNEESLLSAGVRIFANIHKKIGGDLEYVFGAVNGSGLVGISLIPTTDTYGKLRIKRTNVSEGTSIYDLYYWNNTNNSWISGISSLVVPDSEVVQHVHVYPESNYGIINVTVDSFLTDGQNFCFGIFNQTSETGQFNVTFFVNDSVGFINDSETTTFNIITSNTVPSQPQIITPATSSLLKGLTNITWNTILDGEGDSVRFNITLLNTNLSLNSTLVTEYGDITSTSYEWDTSNYTDGQYIIRVTVYENETAEGFSSSGTSGSFTVDNTLPLVTIYSPLNQSYANATVLVNLSASDALTGVDTIWFNNGTGNETYTNSVYRTFSEGSNTFYAYANDSAGNENSSLVTFAVDTTAPSIAIVSPANSSYNNATILVNLTSNGEAIWFNNGTANETYTTPAYRTFSEGSTTLYAYANDSVGNENTTSVTFFVDSNAPVVHLISPADNTVTKTASQTFTCNITNVGVTNLTLYLWNATAGIYSNTTDLSGTENETSWQFTLPYDASFEWNCLGADIGGLFSWSEEGNYSIELDTVDPSVQFVAPTTESGAYVQDYILANVTASDDNLESIDVYFYNSSGLISLNSSLTSPFYLNFSGLPDETYNLQALANDNATNSDSTETRTIYLDHVNPLVVINSPENTTYNNATVLVNLTGSDAVSGVDTIWFYNGTDNETYTDPVYRIFSLGNNTLTAYVNDSAGNENMTVVDFVVTVAFPTITLNSPWNNSVDVDGNVTFNCSATDTNLEKIDFYFGELLNQSQNVSGAENNSIFYINELSNGQYNWSCTSHNTVGSSNSSDTYFLTVNITADPVYNESYFVGNTTDWESVPDITNVCNGTAVLDNPGTDQIRWLDCVNAEAADFNVNVFLDYNNATVITDGLHSSFNSTATITLRNLTWDAVPLVYMDGVLCPPTVCSNVSYDTGTNTAVFNVSHFTSFVTEGNSELQIWDETDVDMLYANQTRYVGNQTLFFADYTQKGSGTPVTGANCSINFTDSSALMSYNVSKLMYEYNRTFSSNGTFEWNVTCTGAGYNTLTTNDTVFINATVDNTDPNVIVYSPLNQTYNNVTLLVNLSATDIGGSVDTIWFNNGTGNETYTVPVYRDFAEGSNTFYAYANDTSGNENTTAVTFFVDTIFPTVAFISPQNTSYSNATILVNISSDGDNLWFFNGTANETYTVPVYRTFAEGSSTIYAYANDTVGNENSTSVTFSIDTTNPLIEFVDPTPNDGSNLSQLNVAVNATASDSALDTITLKLYNSSLDLINTTTSQTSPLYINFTGLSEGDYSFNATVNDTFGNVNQTETRTVTFDVTEPYVAFISPQNTSYATTELLINISSDGLNTWYFNGSANLTYTAETYQNFTDGSHTIFAYSNDSAGNLNTTSVTFFVDAVAPILTVYSPLNQTYNNATVLINFTADSYTGLWYFNETANVTYTGEVYETVSEGSHTYIFYANDSAANLNSTSVTFSIDTNAPTVTVHSPLNQSYGNRTVFVNITATNGGGVDTIWFFNGTENETYTTPVYRTFAEGSNTLIAYANDTLNNIGTDTVVFNADTTPPTVNIIVPLNQTYSNVTQLVNISSDGDYTWFFNGTENETYTGAVYRTFNESSNTIIAYSNDSFNNVGTDIVVFNIDTSAPSIVINSPINQSYNNATILVNLTSGGDYTWFFNGTANETYTSAVYRTFAEGSSTLIAYTNDSLNNIGTSSVTFNIDTITPIISVVSPANQTYNNATVLINFTADSYQALWFYNETANVTYTSEVYETVGEGSHTYIFYANDSVGNFDSTSVTFNIDTNAPTVTINTPLNQTYGNGTILVNITATNGGGVDTTWFYNGSANETYTTPVYRTFSEGSNTLIAYANDTLNNVGTDTVVFNVDLTAPAVSFISPTSTTYNNATVLINISSDGENVWFYNGTENETYTTPVYRTFSENSTTLIAYANDSVGNEAFANVTFDVDTSAPSVTIDSPLNQTYTNATILVDLSASAVAEFALDTVWFYNGTENETYTTPVYRTFAEGSTTLIAYANDTGGNTGSDSVTFFVDTVAPVISNATTTPSLPISNNGSAQNLIVNFTSSEYPINVTFNLYDSTGSVADTSIVVLTGVSDLPANYTIPANLSEGDYSLNMTAEDNGGLSTVTSLGSFDVDITPPMITSTTVDPYAALINGSVFLNSSTSNGNVTLWAVVHQPNGTNDTVNLPEGYFNVSLAGRHVITFYANDTAGNSYNTSDYFESSGINQTINFNVIDGNFSGVDLSLNLYLPGTTKEVGVHSFVGNETHYHPGLLYDLLFTTFNGTTVLFRDVNATLDFNKTLGLEKLSTPVTGYIQTFAVNNTYIFANATVTLNYTDDAFTAEGSLEVYRCGDWNFTGRVCNGTWEDFTSNTTQDTGLNTFTFIVDSFSAFSIKQVAASVTPTPTPSVEEGGGGFITIKCTEEWNCSDWNACLAGIQTRTCIDLEDCGTVVNKPETQRTCEYCNDGILNQDESDVDCGGIACGPCSVGSVCYVSSDCSSGSCVKGSCAEELPAVDREKISKRFWTVMFLVMFAGVLFYFVGAKLVTINKEIPIGTRLSTFGRKEKYVILRNAQRLQEEIITEDRAIVKLLNSYSNFVLSILEKIISVPKLLFGAIVAALLSSISRVRERLFDTVSRASTFGRKEKYVILKSVGRFEDRVVAEERAVVKEFKSYSKSVLNVLKKIVYSPVVLASLIASHVASYLGLLKRRARERAIYAEKKAIQAVVEPTTKERAPISKVPVPEKKPVHLRIKPFISRVDVTQDVRVKIVEREGPGLLSRISNKLADAKEKVRKTNFVVKELARDKGRFGGSRFDSYLRNRKRAINVDIFSSGLNRETTPISVKTLPRVRSESSFVKAKKRMPSVLSRLEGVMPKKKSEIEEVERKIGKPKPLKVMELINKVEKSLDKKIPQKRKVTNELREFYDNELKAEEYLEVGSKVENIPKKKIDGDKLLSMITSKLRQKKVKKSEKKIKKDAPKKYLSKKQVKEVKDWMKSELGEVYK
ncbi:hypothetical protein ACFLZZ_02575 [Nanoarchaeota archaeon]